MMNIGIVGAGKIVKEALPVLEQVSGVVFQSIVTTGRNPQNVNELQKQFNIKEVYENYTQFLEDEDLEVVYIAVPNHLHYYYAQQAIEHGKHVICEKPFTLTKVELETLKELAEAKQVIITEAITNLYLGNYDVLKHTLQEIGDIKLAQFNYSQYSSRYDNFKQDIIQPAFNPEMGGGALMDINVYNVHLAVGLFGKPKGVAYFANVEKNIDTSGILQLDYDNLKVVCIGAKDSSSDNHSYIQGDQATIHIEGPTNELQSFEVNHIGGGTQLYQLNQFEHRMHEEFVKIIKMIQNKDDVLAKRQLEHSIAVVEVLESALDSANITIGPSKS